MKITVNVIICSIVMLFTGIIASAADYPSHSYSDEELEKRTLMGKRVGWKENNIKKTLT